MATKRQLQRSLDQCREDKAALKQRIAELEAEQPPAPAEGMSVLMWQSQAHVECASADDLAALKEIGIDGFHILLNRLPRGAGGNTTTWPGEIKWVEDFADAHPEFDCRIGCSWQNYYTNSTPTPWFDDETWDDVIHPGLADLAHAVKESALNGITFDGENYPSKWTDQAGRHLASNQCWHANPYEEEDGRTLEGGTQRAGAASEAEIRSKCRERAVEAAEMIVAEGGPMKITSYYMRFPGMWSERVQEGVNHAPHPAYGDYMFDEWLDGWSSVAGITFRFIDNIFYKGYGWGGAPPPENTPDGIYQYNIAGWESKVGGKRPNTYLSPFIWITPGPRCRQPGGAGAYDCQRPDAFIAEQLAAARKWTQGGEFALYDQGYICPPTRYLAEGVASAIKAASA